MQDSFTDLLKLLLPEIIVKYFELTSYEKEEKILPIYLKASKDRITDKGGIKLSYCAAKTKYTKPQQIRNTQMA